MDLLERSAAEHRVHMEVTRADAEGQVVIALDDAEAEIIRLQRG